jgi:hypothetical protein
MPAGPMAATSPDAVTISDGRSANSGEGFDRHCLTPLGPDHWSRWPRNGSSHEDNRIIPLGHAYRVEAVQLNGEKRVVRTWPIEEAAVSHLKALREVAERSGRAVQPGERDWRG